MNKKGQIGLGVIMVTFIVILLGVIFTQSIAQEVGSSTNTVALAAAPYTAAANGGDFYLTGYRAISGVTITNTSGTTITDGNYTITNNDVVDGVLVTTITVDAVTYESQTWNITATAQPVTYIADGGARAMAGLIVIMFALAVAVIALGPTIQSRMLEGLGR